MGRLVYNRVAWGGVLAALLCLLQSPSNAAEAPAAPVPADPAAIEFFERKIRPVLADNCFNCHSGQAKDLKAKLLLDSREGMLKGGESELPAVVPGNLDDSSLIRAVRWEDEGLAMPPKKKLAAAQIADLEAWVKMGAPTPAAMLKSAGSAKSGPMTIAEGRKFWSFTPPREPVVPMSSGLGVPPEHSPRPASTSATTAPLARSGETRKPPTASPIDHFINAKLTEKGLTQSPPADKRTLIRRATFDLIGLPPTAAEVEAFEADPSADAYETLVDRLLASPHYGERWGRYWLDVARYADTKGYVFEEERRYAFSFTYRDWVIRAFNDDLPYDQFLIQQIAADRLELEGDKRPLAALGFLTLGRRFLNNQPDIIDDRIDVVTRGTMGLTVSCARCHDHKYDPIPTADYYSLYGVFASTREPDELPLIGGDKPQQAAEYDAELKKRTAEYEQFTTTRYAELLRAARSAEEIGKYLLAAQKKVEPPHPINEAFEIPDDAKGLNPRMLRRWEKYLKEQAATNAGVFEVWRRFAAAPKEAEPATLARELLRRPSVNPLVARLVLGAAAPKSMQEVARRYATAIAAFDGDRPHADPAAEALRLVLRGDDAPANVAPADAEKLFGNVDRMKRRGLKAKIDNLTATHPGSPVRAMAVEDLPKPVEPHVFKRGNAGMPGEAVPRQFLAVLSPAEKREPFKDGSGRLGLARAIASRDNPLTARVMVNRVWQYHFGHGLVRTPSDFGTRGEPPTHPELLDWLALRFAVDDGWSIKKLHKRIMLSAAYRQSSANADAAAAALEKDPENRLLWRMNPRRLDIESMRDALLAASGQLDRAIGGRPVDILAQPFVPRRTVYAFIDRQNLPGMFRTFDFASPDATSAQRFATSVPQQALFMMNSPFILDQTRKLASRPEVVAAADAGKRVETLYRAALGRKPAPAEVELGVKFVAAEAAQPATAEVAVQASPWQYGYGEFDEASQRLKAFYPLAHFTGEMFQGGPKLPDPKLGWVLLTRDGGHAGDDHAHAAVRRWVAPRDVTVSVAGTVAHGDKNPASDGVRARLVSSREGLLATWQIHLKSAETNVASISLKRGETLDFVVDNGRANNVDSDSFRWTVTITKQAPAEPVAGDDTGGTWDSVKEFSGPPAAPPNPMTPWEKYAQVLLQSNEFLFVD